MKKNAKIDFWPDFKQAITQDYEGRKSEDPSYSKRQYALELGLSSGALVEVLNGRRRLSQESCARLLPKLLLSDPQKRKLGALVDLVITKSLPEADSSLVEVLKDWVSFAMLGLCELNSAAVTDLWIAGKLGLTEDEIQSRSIQLEAAGLIFRAADGSLSRTPTPCDLRPFQKEAVYDELLQQQQALALRARRLPSAECEWQTLTVPGNGDLLRLAQSELAAILQKIDAFSEASAEKSELIRVSFQAFRFDFRA